MLDITNKLESRPINLKPSWVGLKQSTSKQSKDIEDEQLLG